LTRRIAFHNFTDTTSQIFLNYVLFMEKYAGCISPDRIALTDKSAW
jgi:hypothetical protein